MIHRKKAERVRWKIRESTGIRSPITPIEMLSEIHHHKSLPIPLSANFSVPSSASSGAAAHSGGVSLGVPRSLSSEDDEDDPVTITTSTKRGRKINRHALTTPATVVGDPAVPGEPVKKRGRGRPRKYPLPNPNEPPREKKPVGRPRKNPSAFNSPNPVKKSKNY